MIELIYFVPVIFIIKMTKQLFLTDRPTQLYKSLQNDLHHHHFKSDFIFELASIQNI